MGLKAAIQALKRAEKLKEKVQNSKDLLNDNEAWVCQQQLQRIYQQVLILDLEYALDRKVEQELWNHGFKNYIGTLQNLAKDKKNPKRNESQAMLSWCLEAASGFYLTLLQEICTAFDLDLPFRRKESVYGNGKLWRTVDHFTQPHKNSCYYICQHCLVHLGDIARYRNQNRQAEIFYRHAVQLAPNSGQPYNQLALLEASRGDRLSTVFHYVRSVAVRHFFPAAATNLSRTLNKSAEEQLNVEGRSKLSVSEYVAVFLKLHGLLHNSSDLQEAEKYVKVLTTTLTAHVATESLTSWKLVQMLAINLFALHHAGSCVDADKLTSFNDDQLSSDERKVKHLVMDLMAGSLSAYLLPVYTLKEGDALLEYFALPAIKLTLDWIRLDPKVLLESAFTSRLQIWPSLCRLLNGLQKTLADFTTDKYSYLPLPEDRDLQGFIPLEKSFGDLRFSCQDWKLDPVSLNKLRASRVLEFGSWLSKQENHRLVIRRSSPGAEESVTVFEAVGGQQVPPCDLIRELEELSLTKLPSPAPSDTSSWGSTATGTSTPDNSLIIGGILGGPHSPPLAREIMTDQPHIDTVVERRTGILKPQGSLEKAREKEATDVTWNHNQNHVGNVITKRGRQNVAMQAIMRKSVLLGEQENARNLEAKQVTFKTPSPSISPGSSQGAEEGQIVKSNKPPAWQQSKQQHHQVLHPLPQSSPQTLNISFPYQNQPASQHNLMQQHNQVPRNQVSQVPSVFDNGELSHQNGILGALHHHNQSVPSNSSNLSSSFGPPISSFPNLPGQMPFHQISSHSSPGANLPLGDNSTCNIGSGFPPSHQSYGMKLRQPPFTPWQEESPPLPPQSWWRGDRPGLTRQGSGSSNPQEDSVTSQTPATQINLPFPAMNYVQGNILQQSVQRITMKSPTDLVSGDLYGSTNWHSRHQMSAPPPPLNLNINLQHQLMSGTSNQHPGNFTQPTATQASISRSLLRNNAGYQSSQNRPDTNQLSVFANSGSQEAQRLNSEVSDCTNKESQPNNSVTGAENSTIFSSTPNTSSFSALGLGTNTYSLFSTPSWVNPAPTCGRELEGNSCVMGVPGNNALSIGQQSLWSGPGPSPLERLLEQQKQLREGPAPKGGT